MRFGNAPALRSSFTFNLRVPGRFIHFYHHPDCLHQSLLMLYPEMAISLIEAFKQDVTLSRIWAARFFYQLNHDSLCIFKILFSLRLVFHVSQHTCKGVYAQYRMLVFLIGHFLCKQHFEVQAWRQDELSVLARGNKDRDWPGDTFAVLAHG